MATIIDALIVTLDLDIKSYEKKDKQMQDSLKNMKVGVDLLRKAYGFLKDTVSDFLDAADDVGKFADMNGIAVEQVGALDNAVKLTGGSVSQMRGTIADLSKQMNGLYPVNPFAAIGVRATDSNNKIKPMTKILTEVAGKMEGLSKVKQADIGQKLGLDESTIRLLQQGQAGVQKLFERQKELGSYTDQDTKMARRLNSAMAGLNIAWQQAAAAISRVLTPALEFFTDIITDIVIWMRKNSGFVIGFFSAIGTAIAFYVLPFLANMAVAMIAATWPFLLFGAIIGLLIDDFLAWKNGGESALGFIWKYGAMALEALTGYFKGFFEFVKPIFPIIKNLAGRAFEGMATAAKVVFDVIKTIFGYLEPLVSGSMGVIVGIFTGDLDKVKSSFMKIFGGLKKIVTDFFGMWGGLIGKITGYFKDKIANVFGSIKSKFSGFFSFFGGGDKEKEEEEKQKTENITNSRNIVAQGAQPQQNQMNKSVSNNQTIGQIVVNTQAVDAKGISQDLGHEIRKNTSTLNQADRGMF